MKMTDYKITLADFPEKYFQHFGMLRRPLPDLGFKDLLELYDVMPDPHDVQDVQDEEEENERVAQNGGVEDNEHGKAAFERLGLIPVKPFASLPRGVRKVVGYVKKN